MEVPKLDHFVEMARTDIDRDDERDENIAKFDDILSCTWEAPEALRKLDWWQDVVTSTPADGIDAAVRAFATNMPSLRIFPSNVTDEARERAEAIEDTLMWHFRKANQRSVRRPIEVALESMLKYGAVGAQVKYLPYHYKAELEKKDGESFEEYEYRTRRIKAMRAQGDFTYLFHPVSSMHPCYSQDMLERMTLAKVMTVADLAREFGKDNKGIKKMLDYLDTDKIMNGAIPEDTYCTFYEVEDYAFCARFAVITNEDVVDKDIGGERFEIYRDVHKLPFFPWVYKACSKPLLQTVVDAGSWERQNELLSMYRAMMVAVVAHPYMISTTFNGEPLDVDYTQPGGQVVVKPGESASAMPPRQTDPELVRQIQQGETSLGQQINTKVLTTFSEYAQTSPYASANAMLTQAMSQLADKRLAVESFWEDVFALQMRWVNYSKIDLVGSRSRNRRNSEYNPMLKAGAQVTFGSTSIPELMMYSADPDNLLLKVRLNENTQVDRQTRLNSAIMLHREAPIAMSDCLEYFGLDDLEIDEKQWMQEQFTMAAIQSKVKEIASEGDVNIRNKIIADFMKEQQAQAKAQAGSSGQAPATPAGEEAANIAGQNMLGQGMPGNQESTMANPGMTREMITGMTQGGEEVPR